MSQTIEILVRPDGKTTVQTRGFRGASCREASRFLEEALGQRAGEQLTAEFHQSQASQVHQQQHG
jgi:hypothetical protein